MPHFLPDVRNHFILAIAAAFLALGFVVTTHADEAKAPAATQPSAGDKAMDFSLKTLDDKTVQLSDLNKTGPVVVVELRGWVGYQCPICTRQVGDLRGHAKELLASGARIVLVYPGPADGLKEHAKDFITGKGLPEGFFFVLDPDLKFVNAWGLRWDAPRETAYPATFVVNEKGAISYAKISKGHGDRATAVEILKALNGK